MSMEKLRDFMEIVDDATEKGNLTMVDEKGYKYPSTPPIRPLQESNLRAPKGRD